MSDKEGGWFSSSHGLTVPGVTRRTAGPNDGTEEEFPCSARWIEVPGGSGGEEVSP